jgi:hypothetical protein
MVLSTVRAATNVAIRGGHTEAVVTLLDFLTQMSTKYPMVLENRSDWLAEAMALGYLDLVRLMVLQQQNDPDIFQQYRSSVLWGLQCAVESGHTKTVQYVFESSLVNPKIKNGNLIRIAARCGHRAIIGLAVGLAIRPRLQDLISALNHNNTNMTLTVQCLLGHNISLTLDEMGDNGEPVVLQLIETVESLCRKAISVPCGSPTPVVGKEKILALILVAQKMKLKCPELMVVKSIELGELLARLAKGDVKLPTEPVPYLSIVKEVHEWIVQERQNMEC